MNPNHSHKVGVLRHEQTDQLARFLEGESAGGLNADEWRKKFDVLWERNPFFDQTRDARGWAITDENGDILGFLGNIPAKYVRGGEEEICYWATTWFVVEKARARSLDLFRQFMLQPGVLFDTTPTPEVELIIAKRFKFTRLNKEWIKIDYLLPINLRGCVCFAKWRLSERPILRLFALPACIALMALTAGRALFRQRKLKSHIKVRQIESLPGDLSAWWIAYKSRSCFTLVRNERAMQWLFFSESMVGSRKVLEVRLGGSLIGFVAMKLNRQPTFATVDLIDVALLELSEEIIWAVVLKLQEVARHWGDDIAFIQANALNDAMEPLLARAGFWRRKGRARYYYFDRDRKLSADEIYATPVDGDRGLFP